MNKSLLKLSRPCVWGPYTVILSESGSKQCQSSMNSSQNLASLKSSISTSLSNREKYQNPTKDKDLVTMKISEATPNQYTTSIPMVASHQKIMRKFLEHLRRKGIREISTKDQHKAAKEAELRTKTEAVAEGLTHSNLRTACTTATQPIIAPKIAHLSRDKKENGAGFHKTFAPIHSPKSQLHHAMSSSPPAIPPIPPFTFFTTSLS
jgi:hypothetical protein